MVTIDKMKTLKSSLLFILVLKTVAVVGGDVDMNRELTLERGARGCEVTKAAVDRVEASGIFKKEHHFLLYRVAFASLWGEWVFVSGAVGIWQFTQKMLDQAKAGMLSLKIKKQLESEVCIDFASATLEDMEIPLLAVVGAYILIEINGGAPERVDVTAQIKFWSGLMGEIVVKMEVEIREKAKILDENKGEQGSMCLVCREQPSDIIFIIDDSGSISNGEWDLQIRFVKTVLERLQESMSHNASQVSLIFFAYKVEQSTPYTSDYKSVIRSLDGYGRTEGRTNIPAANYEAVKRIKDIKGGSRRDDQAVRKFVFLLTDGTNNEQVMDFDDAASKLKREPVFVYAIGTSDSVNQKELQKCATNPSYVRRYNNFNDFSADVATILYSTCKIGDVTKAKINRDVSVPPTSDAFKGLGSLEMRKLSLQDSRYFKVDFIANTSMRLSMLTKMLALNIYASFNQEYPNEASYHFKIEVVPGQSGEEMAIQGPENFIGDICKTGDWEKDLVVHIAVVAVEAPFCVDKESSSCSEDCVANLVVVREEDDDEDPGNFGTGSEIKKTKTKNALKLASALQLAPLAALRQVIMTGLGVLMIHVNLNH